MCNRNQATHLVPITTLKNVGGRGCSSLLRNLELLSIRWSSLNVYASPAGVPASMIKLKLAANGGVTRSSLGTNSTITIDRKSTRLNSSHLGISYAVFCLKKKKKNNKKKI